jgi:glycosyltransferase involved in cell wall biosynthesis
MERYENRQWPAFPVRAVVSEVDAEQMRRRVATGKIVIAPNGADPSIWLPDVKQASHTVLFTGHLAYPPNIDALEFLASEIWPRVRKKAPGTTLIIAGRSPTERVNACAHTAGAELHAGPQFMHRIARRAALTIVPLRFGSGTRVKILESLAWGLPVVSTTLGCEGLDVIDGEHLLVRDDPAQFADAVVQLLSDTALWQKLRNQGRELIRESYNWERVFEPLEMALLELVS